jgi:hypothetical protein
MVDFINQQLSPDQDSGSDLEDIGTRMKKLFNFFIGSIRKGDTAITEILMAHHLFQSLTSEEKNAAFIKAAKYNGLGTLQALYRTGVISEKTIKKAFKTACAKGSIDTVNYLLTNDIRKNCRGKGFIAACKEGRLSVIESLKNRIRPADIVIGFQSLCGFGDPQLVRVFLDSPHLQSKHIGEGFLEACSMQKESIIRLLLENPRLDGLDCANGFKQLSLCGNASLVKIILDADKIPDQTIERDLRVSINDPNILKLFVSTKKYNRFISDIFVAACRCSLPIAKQLMGQEKVSSLAIRYSFHDACYYGRREIVELLKDHPEIQEEQIQEGIMSAQRRGDEALLRILQSRSAAVSSSKKRKVSTKSPF